MVMEEILTCQILHLCMIPLHLSATCQVQSSPETAIGYDAEAEKAVQAITDQILSQMK